MTKMSNFAYVSGFANFQKYYYFKFQLVNINNVIKYSFQTTFKYLT